VNNKGGVIMSNTRTLVITATGAAKASPDVIDISFSASSGELTYEKAAKSAKKKMDYLQKGVEKLGIDGKKLKTTDYSVRSEYKNKRLKDGSNKSVFVGYRCRHNVALRIVLDFELLNKVLTVIGEVADTGTDNDTSNIDVVFTVKDTDSLKESVIRDAIRKAKVQADIIAAESGVTLAGIKEINYSFSTVNFNSSTRPRLGRTGAASYGSVVDSMSDITPEDVKVKDNITITWEIT
jgi:hypothetical protein